MNSTTQNCETVGSEPCEVRWEMTLAVAAIMGLAALAVSQYDAIICQYFAHNRLPSDLKRLIDLSEVMAHGLTVAVILLLVHRVALPVRPLFWWMVACPIAGGLVANLLKSMISRVRPYKFWELQAGDAGISHSFSGWMPILESDYLKESWRQAFPSGHAATAFSFAVALSWAFPRGRYYFYGLATLAGLQRIVSNSHWPSDVLVGGALGLLAGTCVKALAKRQAVRVKAFG